MPLYEYYCEYCKLKFEKLEKVSSEDWKALSRKRVYCNKCGTYSARKIISSFKIGSKVLETTGKSGYETDDLTLGKIIDEGGIPAEEKRRLKKRDEIIKRQNKYARDLNRRAKVYNFDPFTTEKVAS